jgi:hypothetical protein
MVPGWPNTCMSPFDDAEGWMAGCGMSPPGGRFAWGSIIE